MGAELCLAHDIGGWRHSGPLSVDMRPYGCFIVISEQIELTWDKVSKI